MAKVKKPIILALCADGREPDVVRRVIVEETLAGALVLAPDLDWRAEARFDLPSDLQRKMDILQLRRIEAADEVLILDMGDITERTRRDIAYAESLGKDIRYQSTTGDSGLQLSLDRETGELR